MRPEDRQVTLGNVIGISEQDAVGVFREITVEEVDAVLDPHFRDPEPMIDSLTSTWSTVQMGLFSHLHASNPAAYSLGKIIETQFSEPDLRLSQIDRFSRIMNKSGSEAEAAVNGMHEVHFVFRGLMAGIAGAFTPSEQRRDVFDSEKMAIKSFGLSPYQGEQITRGVADFSYITKPHDVVNVVGRALLIDRETAMEQAALESGVALDELNRLRSEHPAFREVYMRAAQALYDGTLIGAMLDHEHEGATNVFRPEPNPEGQDWDFKRYQPQFSRRGICTGSPFVMTSMMAMGRVIRRNERVISAVIREYSSSIPVAR